jgi:ribosomal protein L10
MEAVMEKKTRKTKKITCAMLAQYKGITVQAVYQMRTERKEALMKEFVSKIKSCEIPNPLA